jgi:hypothetical protein
MRVLYILRSLAHFSYHESIIQPLASAGHALHLLFDKNWSGNRALESVQTRLAGDNAVTLGWSLRRKDIWRGVLSASRETLSYASYLTRPDQSPYYTERWRGYLPAPLRWATSATAVRNLLARPSTQDRLRAYEQSVPPDAAITRWLKDHRPDILIASPVNMRFSEEVEYVKAAVALGIPAVVPVLSWDNLTTKGLFHIAPDLTLVWNQRQWAEATQIHHLPPEKVAVTGSPFFDKWLDADRFGVEREVFCGRVGLDPRQPFLLYLGSSANIARDETWLVRELANRLRQRPVMPPINILVRPHPANARIYEQLDEGTARVWPKHGALPESEESLRDFYNSLHHCAAAIGINTTGMIDAVIVGKPCLTLMTDHYRATQLQATHFRYLLEADVLEIADSVDACLDRLAALLSGADSRAEARQRFVREFARPRGIDKPAGAVAAQVIEAVGQGKIPRQVIAEIAALSGSVANGIG